MRKRQSKTIRFTIFFPKQTSKQSSITMYKYYCYIHINGWKVLFAACIKTVWKWLQYTFTTGDLFIYSTDVEWEWQSYEDFRKTLSENSFRGSNVAARAYLISDLIILVCIKPVWSLRKFVKLFFPSFYNPLMSAQSSNPHDLKAATHEE